MTDRDLFIAALERPDPLERAAWLDAACAGDPGRRRRVDVLLRAHDQASRFLAVPAAEGLAAEAGTLTGHPADEATPEPPVDVRTFLSPSDIPGHLGRLDHFEVLEVVGKGGMGVVLKALDPKLHRLVALKVMAPHLAASGAARRRFEREARAVAAVKNEHVVAIHDVAPNGPCPYLVMEFVGGMSLQDRLERSGPLDVKEVLRIGLQAANGLAAAHRQGIVHRDVKPANILLENGVERVKLSDFGLARTVDDANLTQSGVIAGTPNYMSPEQANGSAVDARSDLFSLGSVLYALCAGHPPFRADTAMAVLKRVCDDDPRPLAAVNADVPPWLDAIVRKLLAKVPNHRFQTADQVAELLGQHLAHLQNPAAVPPPTPVVIPLPGPAEPDWKPLFEGSDRRRPVAHFVLFLIGVLALAACIMPDTSGLRWPLTGVGLVFVALALRSPAWLTVDHKGRTIRFENSVLKGQRLLVDERLIAAGGFGRFAAIRGTIPDGAGAGDEIRATPLPAAFRFVGRLEISEGSGAPAAPVARPSAAPAVGCLLVLLTMAGFVAALIFRDTLWEQLFRRGHLGAVFLAFVAVGIAFVTWLFRKSPLTRRQPIAHRLGLVLAVAGVVAGGVLWWRHFGDSAYTGLVLATAVLGTSLANVAINAPAAFRRLAGVEPDRERRQRRTARLVTAGFVVISLVCLGSLLADPEPEGGLDLAWNRAFVAEITVERDGEPFALPEKYSPGRGFTVPPGHYTVTGTRDGRVVYREAVTVEPGTKERHVLWAFEDGYPEGVPTLAVEAAAGLTFTLTGPDHWCTWASGAGEPAGPATRAVDGPPPDTGLRTVRQGLHPDQAYLLEVHRGGTLVHTEGIRLAAGEHRVIPIGRIGPAGRAVELKPESGSFPTDVIGMTFSPDRSLVAAARLDGPILVFDAATGRERFTVRRLKSDCSAFGFTPDGKHLVYVARPAQGPQAVRFVSASDGTPGIRLDTGPERGLMNSRALAFSPDGKRLAVATAINTPGADRFMSRILRWEAATAGGPFRELAPIEWIADTITALRFSPDGDRVRAVSGNASPVRYEWKSGHADQWGGGIGAFDALAAGPVADVATGWSDWSKSAVAWLWPHGQPESVFNDLPRSPIPFGAAAVSGDGSRVALGTKGGGGVPWELRAVVHVHDSRARQEIAVLLGPTDWVMDVAFGPDGKEVKAASKDGTVWGWRLSD